MYSSNRGDARSTNFTANARDSTSSSMPTDHPSGAVWDRQSYSRDKFDRADRDRYSCVKKEWSLDNRSPSYRSLFSNSNNLTGPKRRALGRHGSLMENSRYGSTSGGGSGRPFEPSMLRSPTENGKPDRDMCNMSSPGYNGSSGSLDRTNRDVDVHHFRESHLSIIDSRPLSSPRFDPSPRFDSRPYGSQGGFESSQSRDKERTKFGYDWESAPHRDRDTRDRAWSRSDYHRRTCSLPKLDSPRDWVAGERDLLEGRIDRYGTSLSRETSLPDGFASNAKDHPRPDWRSKDRCLSNGLSSWTTNSAPGTNSAVKDIESASVCSDASGSASPPSSTPVEGSVSHASKRDDPGQGGSSKKRPRLTWGQGLAKYEKEKTEEDPSKSGRIDDSQWSPAGTINDKESSTLELEHSSLQDHGGILCEDNCEPCQESKAESCELQDTNQVKECCEDSALPVSSVGNSMEQMSTAGISSSDQQEIVLPSKSGLKQSVLQDVEVFLKSYNEEKPNVSKDVLTQHLEVVELEIDLIEKEILKLDNEDASKAGPPLCPLTTVNGLEASKSKPQVAATDVELNFEFHVHKAGVRSGLKLYDGANSRKHTLQQISDHGTSKDICGSIMLSNQHTAEQSQVSLSHFNACGMNSVLGGRLYSGPQEATVWKVNAEHHERKRMLLMSKVAEEKRSIRFTERVLAIKFRAQREAWKHAHLVSKCLRKDWDEISHSLESDQKNRVTFSNNRKSVCLQLPNARPSSEVLQVAKKLAGESWTGSERAYLRMPSMLLRHKSPLVHEFATRNALVEDPVAVEVERKTMNPWTEEERKIFLEKFSVLGKNFHKIASFLDHKTVADCVQFYYRNHKNEEFEKVRRRHQLRKRRDSRSNALYLATTTSASSRHREANAGSIKGLALVAVAAAAMSGPRDSPKVGKSASLPCTKGSKERQINKQPSNSSTVLLKSVDEEQAGAKASHSTNSRTPRASQDESDTQWSDNEREMFIHAVAMFGKDFSSISQHVGTKNQAQCKTFFIKARKRLGLDQVLENHRPLAVKAAEHNDGSILSATEDINVDSGRDLSLQSRLTLNTSPSDFAQQSSHDPDVVDAVVTALNSLHKADLAEAEEPTNGNAAPAPTFPENTVKQESSMQCDLGYPLTVGSSSNSEMSLSDAAEACAVDDKSLVCGETLDDSVHVKVEPQLPSNPANGVSSMKPLVVSPVSVVDLHPSVSVVHAALKDRSPKVSENKPRREATSWTQEEKEKFMDILKTHGRDWMRLCESLPAKSLTQIKTYFQNSKAKLNLGPESPLNVNGRLNTSSRKRKTDESDSSSNVGQSIPSQKVTVLSEDGSLKAIPSVLVPPGGNMLGGEALAYASLLRSSLDESSNPVFQSMPLAPNAPTVGILPMFNSSMFTPPSFHSSHQAFVHPASLKTHPVSSHQQSQHPPTPTLTPQPLQQVMTSLGIHQGNPLQQPQPMTRVHQDLSAPAFQHLNKQSAQQQLTQQALVQQQDQQAILQQQILEAILQQQLQPQLVPRQHQQLQLAVQQASSHVQQVLNVHQASSQAVNSLSQASIQSVVSQIPHSPQNQLQQSAIFQPQVHPVHAKSQTVQQHQQVAQIQQLQLLQLHLQQQQNQGQQPQEQKSVAQLQNQSFTLLNEQQKQQLALLGGIVHVSKGLDQSAAHTQQQIQDTQSIPNFAQLQNQSLTFLNEQQKQQQLALIRGALQQTSKGITEVPNQCCSSLQSTKPSQVGASEDLHQSVLSKSQSAPEIHSRAGDVKLFGKSLLSQPASTNQQSSSKAFSGALPQATSSVVDTPPLQNITVTGDPLVPSQAWHQVVWPNLNVASVNNTAAIRSGDTDHEDVAHWNDRVIRPSRNIDDGLAKNVMSYPKYNIQVPDGKVFPNVVSGHGLASNMHLLSDKSGETKRPENDVRTDQVVNGDHTLSVNRNRGQEVSQFSGSTGAQVPGPNGLPRVVLNALVALAEWRLQNSGGGSGRQSDEFLSQSWEALQRDPSSLLEVGKFTGSLAQIYAGGSEMLNHIKDVYSQCQFHSWAGSTGAMPLSDAQQMLSSTLRPQNSVSLEEPGMADVRDIDGSGGSAG